MIKLKMWAVIAKFKDKTILVEDFWYRPRRGKEPWPKPGILFRTRKEARLARKQSACRALQVVRVNVTIEME